MSAFHPDENIRPRSNMVVMSYVVEGAPVALKRPRFGVGRVYDSQKQLKYSVGIQLKVQHFLPLFTGPLSMDVVFYMPIPVGLRKKIGMSPREPHHVKPDIDNLIKFILDVANDIILTDDAQISKLTASKVYSSAPRTEFTITTLIPFGE